MSLQECGLNLNHALRELQPHGTVEFPCAGYASAHSDTPGDHIPWHWHEELEIIYIREGTMKLRVPSEEHIIHAGEMVVLNANLPHEATGAPTCELESLVFSPLLITGSHSSAIARKYVQPLMDCPAFTCCTALKLTDCFQAAFDALRKDDIGYELIVQEQLSHLILALYKEFVQEIKQPRQAMTVDTIRLEQMLKYIHAHFGESISIADIAASAAIGERECMRCFKRTISESPMQYLLKYRLMQAANRLESEPALSITSISENCGFGYTSYFAKQFRRFYLCSPREYRKKHAIKGKTDKGNRNKPHLS